jgi:serpin B
MINNLQIENTTQKLVNTIFRNLICDINDNFVFSPASYLDAIHNLLLCVNGNNLDEMLDILGIDKENIIDYIQRYKKTLNGLENYNTILYGAPYKTIINQDCFNLLKSFGCYPEVFDNPENLVSRVNKLVEEKTRGKIKNLLSRADVNSFTAFAILNCIYFKKQWLQDFDQKHWEKESFFGSQREVKINFLFNEVKHNYFENDVFDIVELPYKNSDICCYLFVPNINHSLFDLTNDWENSYNNIKNLKRDIPVNITVPEFEINSSFSLVRNTILGGIKNVFQSNKQWDLIDWNKSDPFLDLSVENIIQKTFFKFDNKGTEAAAATAVIITGFCSGMGFNNPPLQIKYIRADKPFIFVLADKNNKDIPLFVGQVKQI